MRLILVIVSVKNSVLFFTVQDSSFFCNVLEMAYVVGITTLSVFSHLTWTGISKTADKPVITVSIF
jgi:hypothetical protein